MHGAIITSLQRPVTDELLHRKRPVIWLSAPAGSGKSMVAEDLVQRQSGPSIWLRMETRFQDRGIFLSALLTAFETAMPDKFLPPLGAEDIFFAEAYLHRLLDAALAEEPLVRLVFDDLHELGEDSELSALLAALVRKSLPRLQTILVTRSVPDKAWAWFSANGLDEIVTFEDLRLREEEARILIQDQAQGKAGSSWQADALVAACGGWILGARLLLQRGGHNPIRFSGAGPDEDDGAFLDLVAHEILAPLNDNERAIVFGAAALPNLTVANLAAALGPGFSEAMVDRLVRKTLFLDSVGARRLQVHDLLKAAVKRHGRDAEWERRLQEISVRAGETLLTAGDTRAGLSLLASVEAWDTLRSALIEVAPKLGEAGEFGVLLSVLESVPQAEAAKDIAIRYWHGVSLLNLDPSRARKLLTDAYEQAKVERAEAILIPIWAALVDAIWLEWVDCTLFDPLIDDLAWLQDLAERLQSEEHRALLARGAFAALSFRRPEAPDFPLWEERNLAYFWKTMPRHEAIRRGIQLMFRYCWGDGERWKADQVRTRLNYIFDEAKAAPADICTRHVVSTEFMTIFEPSAAAVIENVENGLAATERHNLFFWDVPMLNAALYKVMSLEDRPRGRHYLDLLVSRLGAHSRPHDVAIHEHFSGYDRWLDGENEAALNHAGTAYRTSLESGFSISPVYYGVALAAIQQSMGRRREALCHIRRARRIATAQRSSILVFIAFLRGAALALAGRNPERAKAYLKVALAAGALKRIYVHPWLRRSEMARLLAIAIEADIETDYATELVRILSLAGEANDAIVRQKPVALRTLGRIDILRGGESALTSAKMQRGPIALALHLVAAGPGGLDAEVLINRLWADVDGPTGRNRLKSTLYRLRQLCGEAGAVLTRAGHVALDPNLVLVDAWDLDALAIANGWDAEARYQRAMSLYHGPFVDQHGADYSLLVYRETLDGVVGAIVSDFVETLLKQRDATRAITVSRDGLARFGYSERLHNLALRAVDLDGSDEQRQSLDDLVARSGE